ncbi:BT1A1 protein, partial [Zapornia atra]|nr:BT1A1 protein [Zapornia atra]
DSEWGIGVARDSVNRKGGVEPSPEGGFWGVEHYKGQLYCHIPPRTPLPLSRVPSRVWVCLDYPRGLVTFIDVHSGAEIF